MFRLRRWYNQNSKTIWRSAGIIAFLILMLQVFNYFAGKNIGVISNEDIRQLVNNEYTDLSFENDKSVLTNQKIYANKNDSIEIINAFFKHCNEGNITKAYELLTEDCKKSVYPDIQSFRNGYYKKIFNNKKRMIQLEHWINDMYKVEISDDILSSGSIEKNNTIQDYISVIEENGEYKLNINRYIGTTEINKNRTFDDNIEIKVEKKDRYMDYEIYTFFIKNNTENPILIDDLKSLDSMYLQDTNNIKYPAYIHEISLSQLHVNAKETRELKIKYYNKYGSEKKVKRAVFSKVILNYNDKDNQKNNNYNRVNVEL